MRPYIHCSATHCSRAMMFCDHGLLLELLVRLVQQLLALIDRLATLPLLRMATKSASTASAYNQALAQADGYASAGNATDGPHLPLASPPSPVMQVRERRVLRRQLARGIVHALLARPFHRRRLAPRRSPRTSTWASCLACITVGFEMAQWLRPVGSQPRT